MTKVDHQADQLDARSILLYGLGLFLICSFIGFSVGLSASPVIATLLPLIFSVLGGASGLYIAKGNFFQPEFQLKMRIMGGYLATLSVGIMLGSVYGIALRTGAPLASFLPNVSKEKNSQLDPLIPLGGAQVQPAHFLEIAALRRRLSGLGVPAEEIAPILEIAWQEIQSLSDRSDIADKLQKISDTASIASEYFEELHRPHNDERFTKMSLNIAYDFKSVAEEANLFASEIKKYDVAESLIANKIGEWSKKIFSEKSDIQRILAQSDRLGFDRVAARGVYFKLFFELSEARQELKNQSVVWSSELNLSTAVDKMLSQIPRSDDENNESASEFRRPYFTVPP